ncbi:MAG: tetratricopeptide repeat protein [Candidatus Sumerlaeia bacterium]|nr:tetratricopeptide repeat protein [Candidatus Sumerlaeia bacterium]
MFAKPRPHTATPQRALTAKDWARRAATAHKEGALRLAVDCARRATLLSPLNPDIRELYTQLLYQRVEREIAGEALEPANVSPIPDDPFPEEFDQHMAPPPAQRPAPRPIPRHPDAPRPQRPPQQPAARAPRAAGFSLADLGSEFDHAGVDEDPAPPEPARRARRTRPIETPFDDDAPRRRWLKPAIAAAAAILLVALVAAMLQPGVSWGTLQGGEKAFSQLDDVPAELREELNNANRLLGRGQAHEAVSVLRAAVVKHPSNSAEVNSRLAWALAMHAKSRSAERDHTGAVKALEEATRLLPGEAELWEQLGRTFREQAASTTERSAARRQLASAETAYRRALERQNDRAAALLGLGEVYAASDDAKRAREQFNAVLEKAPRSSEAKVATASLRRLGE